ncbi:flippase [candidate division KSB1 bacterium]|nr:flippase [candidate division KSB1 bacterium]
MKNNNLKKNTYFVATGQLAQKVLAFALIPFAARYLGDDGFGKFSLASTIMFFVFLLNDLGINTYITREIARDKKLAEKYFYNAIAIKMLIIVFNFMVLLIFLKFANYSIDTNKAIIIFAGYGIATSIFQMSVGVYQAFERMEYEAIIYTFEKIFVTALGILLLYKGFGLIVFCGVFLAGGTISIFLSIFILERYFSFRIKNISIEWKVIRSLVVNSTPFGLSILISTIYNYVGILLLSLMQSPEIVGWYAASSKFISITNIIPMVLIAATYPALSRGANQADSRMGELYNKCFRYLTFVALPTIVGTVILSRPIVDIIYGSQYTNAILPLKILAWAAALVYYNIFFTGVLKAANLQTLMVKILLVALTINTVLNVTLIHYFSYIGAAITTVSTEVFIFLTHLFIIHKRVIKLDTYAFILKGLFATTCMGIFCYYFRNHNFFVNVLGSIVILVVSLYMVKGFTLEEILPTRMNGFLKRGVNG